VPPVHDSDGAVEFGLQEILVGLVAIVSGILPPASAIMPSAEMMA
jgi:hypothetical protein